MRKLKRIVASAVIGWLGSAARAAVPDVVLPQNLEVMQCAAPDAHAQFVRGSQPGNIFFSGEAVDITVKLDGDGVRNVELGILEITSRHDEYVSDKLTGMAPAPRLAAIGKPIVKSYPIPAMGEVELKDLPVPARFGCYAVTISEDGKPPAFLCTLLRAHKPIEGYSDRGPIMGEAGQFFGNSKDDELTRKAQTLARMGVKMVRFESGPYKPSQQIDNYMQALTSAKVRALVTMGAHSPDYMPFHAPTPAVGRSDYVGMPKFDEQFGQAVEAFCRKYWNNGESAFWGIENWNEPWEPTSISGFESDGVRYRALLRHISAAAKRVDPRIKICAACSIMNTEDKLLTGDDRAENMKLIDCMTDHYVGPRNAYGPMVAHHWGKRSFETETWGGATETLLAQFVLQFSGNGQTMINPWTSDMVYYNIGGKQTLTLPTPTALATNVIDYFLTNRPFEKMLFLKNLPFAFQFGGGNEPGTGGDAVVVLVGRLQPRLSFFGWDPKDVLWWQFNLKEGGTITIDNADGLLAFFDIGGNPEFEGQSTVTLPLDFIPHYIRSPKAGAGAIEKALAAAKIEGVRPVEILARDFTMPVTSPQAAVVTTLHNLLNRKITGTLTLTPPAGVTLKSNSIAVTLDAGETKDFSAGIAHAAAVSSNAYPFTYKFDCDGGSADWEEALSVNYVRKSTKKIDGSLDDWKDDLGVVVVAKLQKADAIQKAWLPFQEQADKQPDGSFAEVKLAYDEQYLYVAARVNDPTDYAGHARLANWDEEQFFHNGKDDALCETMRPYEDLCRVDPRNAAALAKAKADPRYPAFEKAISENPALQQFFKSGALRTWFESRKRYPDSTFADASYVYKTNFAVDSPWTGDTFQFGFDVIPGYAHHDLDPDTDRVPEYYHAMPDTDFEFSAYQCTDGGAELWRLLAPGIPRGHHFPRQPRAKFDQGAVTAKTIVKREGKTTIYEMAIPWSELKEWKPTPGQTFGFTFRVNNNKGPTIFYGQDKSVTKYNGLSLHPYWDNKPSCTVKWAIGD